MREITEAMKALSEEVRLRLLLLLSDGELCVCDLMGALKLPQSTISRHLAYLKNRGWVDSRRQGVWMHYRPAESLGSFKAKILNVLLQEFKGSDQARKDAANLMLYIKNQKGGSHCA